MSNITVTSGQDIYGDSDKVHPFTVVESGVCCCVIVTYFER